MTWIQKTSCISRAASMSSGSMRRSLRVSDAVSATSFTVVNLPSTSSGLAEIVGAGETGIGVGVGGVGLSWRGGAGRPFGFQRGAMPSASSRTAAAPARITDVMCGMSTRVISSLG
jgi:hypothetical protein